MVSMNGTDLVVKIDALLKQRNTKRQALADYCEINVQSFADWTRRGTLPNIEIGLKIAKYLGVSIEWLLDDEYAKSWLNYDDNTTTHDMWMSPSGIVRRLETVIRERLSVDTKINKDELDERFFESILDIITLDQIKAAYQNRYEPTIIQLYEISKRMHLSLAWLITGKNTDEISIDDQFVFGIAKEYSNLLKFYNCLPISDQQQIQNLVVHLFHSRRKIRDALVDMNVDLKNIPELLQ